MIKNKTKPNWKLKSCVATNIANILCDVAATKYIIEANLKKQINFGISEQKVMNHKGKLIKASNVIKEATKDTNIAFDAAVNSYTSSNIPNSYYMNQINNLLIDNFFLGYAELSLLLQNSILSNICSTYANEMTKKWIKFYSKSKNKSKLDKIQKLEEAHKKYKIRELFNRAVYLTFAFGGVMIYPHLKDDFLNMGDNLQSHLTIDKMTIGKGDLLYFNIVEPIWYVPIQYNTLQPLLPDFYKPTYYSVMGTTIHESRLIKFIINEAPNIIKPTYLFNGISMIQQNVPYVTDFESVRTNIVKIIQRYNISVLKTGAEAIINDNANSPQADIAAQNLANRINVFNLLRDNFGTFVIDKDNEEFVQLTMSLSNLDKIVGLNRENICLSSKIPPMKLYGLPPSGLNATGKYEIDNYYGNVHGYQESFRPNLDKMNDLIMLSEFGEIDEDIGYYFETLYEVDAVESSTIRYNDRNGLIGLVNGGIITSFQAAETLASNPDSGFNNLEIKESDYPLSPLQTEQNTSTVKKTDIIEKGSKQNVNKQQ